MLWTILYINGGWFLASRATFHTAYLLFLLLIYFLLAFMLCFIIIFFNKNIIKIEMEAMEAMEGRKVIVGKRIKLKNKNEKRVFYPP
jgi:hypothetical protein